MLGMLAAALMQGATTVASVPAMITQPTWVKLPVAEDMAKFYPAAAVTGRVEGRATISCRVIATGELTNCEVKAEEPAGQGFGEAALAMSSLFKMLPKTKSGQPVDGAQINIPIRFALPSQDPPPALPRASPPPAQFELTTSGPKAFKWIDRPNYQEMTFAMVRYSKVRSGEAVLFCWFAASGRLDACKVESETPAKVGLGNAALSLTPLFHIARTTADGGSVAGGTLRIPFHFFSP